MKIRGFTLIELLVTLAIVGILAAVAWPGYGAIMQRAQRNDARLALLGIQYAEEQHYQSALAYSGRLAETTAQGGLNLEERSASGSYALTVGVSEDGQHYTATAQAMPGNQQARDRACRMLAIDETGRRRSADAAGNWSEDPRSCWQ